MNISKPFEIQKTFKKRAMLPDVIDSFMLETGKRNQSIFYSLFVFFGKLSSGIGNILASLVLEYKKIDKPCSNFRKKFQVNQ